MRPVPPCAADRTGAAVPSARGSLHGSRQALSSCGLRSVPTPAARTCRRTQHLWGRTRGAMTAALVIVLPDPARLSATAHCGRAPGSTVEPQGGAEGCSVDGEAVHGERGRGVACHVRRPARPGQDALPGVPSVTPGPVDLSRHAAGVTGHVNFARRGSVLVN